MAKSSKTRASKQKYVSPGQGVLPCFETPLSRSLTPDNRWVVLAGQLPWDLLVSIYRPQDIAYPTDLTLVNDAREKSEELIDLLYDKSLHGGKVPDVQAQGTQVILGRGPEKEQYGQSDP